MKGINVKLLTGIILLLAAGFLFGQDREQVRSLLLATDKQSTEFNYEIVFAEKVNMGIPEGDNWLIVWKRDNTNMARIYAIEGTEVKRKEIAVLVSRPPQEFSSYDIYQFLPGMTVENGIFQIGDFNGDGLDEILIFGAGASRWEVHIYGYERETDDIELYCGIPHGLIDPENGPSPLEFLTYKGMWGFKVYYNLYWRSSSDPSPKNIIRNKSNGKYAWYFYTWDETRREYIEVGEYLEGSEYAEAEEEPTEIPPEPEPEDEPAPPVLAPPGPSAPAGPTVSRESPSDSVALVFFIALASGLLVLVTVLIVVLLRKRNKLKQ
jgi:hypothetical protein